MSKNNSELAGSIMLLIAAIVWGFSFVFQSMGGESLGPFSFNSIRYFIGAAALLPVIAVKKRRGDYPDGRAFGENEIKGGLSCGFCLAGASYLQQYSLLFIQSGKVGFITALYVVCVPVAAFLIYGKKTGTKIIISVILAGIGLWLLCGDSSFSAGLGDIPAYLCMLGFTFHILLIDKWTGRADGVVMSCIQFIVAGAAGGIIALFTETFSVQAFADSLVSLLYCGVMSCSVAYTLQMVFQRDVPPAKASVIMSLESVFSVVGGWIILGEVLSGRQLIGCGAMLAAIILAQL